MPPTPVTSYAQGRTCADSACETALSRYNKAERCWLHSNQLMLVGRDIAPALPTR